MGDIGRRDYGYVYMHSSSPPAQLTRQPGPDPELQLYTAVTGRQVFLGFTHAQWADEYAVTGQPLAMERMLALVTETTHCDALDGPQPAPAPAPVSRHIKHWQAPELKLSALIVPAIIIAGIILLVAI